MAASWAAVVQAERPAVGCFCPVAVLHHLREAFGPDLECDGVDMMAGHAKRTALTAAELGIRPNSPVVLCAVRNEVQFGPRYEFRLCVGPGAFVSGRLDRYSVYVVCEDAADFPEPSRGRFVEFLRSLRLGEVAVDGM